MSYLKNYFSLFVAILFHLTGVLGILFTPYKDWFVNNTPMVLLTMFLLLSKSQDKFSLRFVSINLIAFIIGMITEIIGVNTGLLFGHYTYGTVLGPKLYGVPLLIGFNWFIIVFCAGSFMTQFLALMQRNTKLPISPIASTMAVVLGGAILATCFDHILEPVAVKLHFWSWENGQIPLLNYFCWFAISAALLSITMYIKRFSVNKFASSLFIIQTLFFLALNLFL